MGYVPIFIVTAGIMFLWGMTAYYTLKNRLQELDNLAMLLAQSNSQTNTQELKQQHDYALRMYNATVKDGAAKFWARVFGFKLK